jgi:hypothetical protein
MTGALTWVGVATSEMDSLSLRFLLYCWLLIAERYQLVLNLYMSWQAVQRAVRLDKRCKIC